MSEPIPKRARLHQQQQQQEEQSITSTSSAGYIQVVDVEPSGKFIKIKNMSSQVCDKMIQPLQLYEMIVVVVFVVI